EIPYVNLRPEEDFNGASGIGDLIIGTKTLLLDCELLQFAFGLKTFIPVGNVAKGLGTGHVSLEPELIAALKLSDRLYFQGELAYRFPIGGNQNFAGPMVHYHLGLNYLLWHCGEDIKLIGGVEGEGYYITGGEFTAFNAAGQPVLLSAKDVGNIFAV